MNRREFLGLALAPLAPPFRVGEDGVMDNEAFVGKGVALVTGCCGSPQQCWCATREGIEQV